MSAIAYFVFNRPQHTRKSFERIRNQRPERLFVIADGPRREHPEDQGLCEEVRSLVEDVDWVCEVQRDYADENLGLKERVVSGLDWVFSQVDRAIVLEDDCVAHPDFFTFCEKLLERYEADPRVSTVTGNNFQAGRQRGNASYYFSKYTHVWGWATWRRSWSYYDGDISFWPEWRFEDTWKTILTRRERRYWESIFDSVSKGEIDTWDYQWTAVNLYHGGLTATPNVNLVTNIGFGQDATHTKEANNVSHMPAHALGRLTYPLNVELDRTADRRAFEQSYLGGISTSRRLVGSSINRGRTILGRLGKSGG